MQFDFGRNWQSFSLHALTDDRVAQARADLARLFDGIEITGKSFLDIGFGQGLSLLCAAELGALAVGCDINPTCAAVLRHNARFFPDVSVEDVPLVMGSILDAGTQSRIRDLSEGGFDIVHSWGVLHHTGEMCRAIEIAAGFVATGGHLVIAIYNRHWTSPIWLGIKWLYNRLPRFGERVLVAALYPVIWTAKLAVTRRRPRRQERGMDFYYDVVDWIGGYPYETISAAELTAWLDKLGFSCLRLRPPTVPTGCNEAVFVRYDAPS